MHIMYMYISYNSQSTIKKKKIGFADQYKCVYVPTHTHTTYYTYNIICIFGYRKPKGYNIACPRQFTHVYLGTKLAS